MSVTLARIYFSGSVLIISSLAFIGSLSFTTIARYMPITVAGLAGTFSAIVLITETVRLRNLRRNGGEPAAVPTVMDNSGDDDSSVREVMRYLAWMFGFVGLMALVGSYPAIVVFIVTFLRTQAQMAWSKVAIGVVAVLAALHLFSITFGLRVPPSLVQVIMSP